MELFAKSLRGPEGRTRFPNGVQHVVELHGAGIGLVTFEPGWRWSNDLKPIAGTQYCMRTHEGTVLSGRLHIEMANGETLDLTAGDVFSIPPGHDGWVVGDDACTMLDWGTAITRWAGETSVTR